VYNKTVGRGKDAGLTRLTGDVLEQCWEILTVGKMINGFGKPPPPHTLLM